MTRFVKPAPGRKVRRPEHRFRPLPAEGMPVEWSNYWERLQRDGDILITDAPAETEAQSEEVPVPPAGKKRGGDA